MRFSTGILVFFCCCVSRTVAQPKLRGLTRVIDSFPEDKKDRKHRVLQSSAQGIPSFIIGSLGHIDLIKEESHERRLAVISEATGNEVFKAILSDNFGAVGDEVMDTNEQLIHVDDQGSLHVRYQEYINGFRVEGAAMVMHVSADGTVYAVNGEFVSSKSVAFGDVLDAETALNTASTQLEEQLGEPLQGAKWLGEPELVIVYGTDEQGHQAWKNTLAYKLTAGPPQKDVIFASASTGELVARHPQVFAYHARHLPSGPSIETRDCGSRTSRCATVSNSPEPISTGDEAIDAAHNNALKTYNYYLRNFGRDSMDGNGMEIVSRVHYDKSLDNAFWDGVQMTYGDGDGVTIGSYSLDLGIVAHELTHGVTTYSSNLLYYGEPGALNEAMSDIFAAAIEREDGHSFHDSWLLGDDPVHSNATLPALRYMRNPALFGDSDYWPERYNGTGDNGGVHINSGIANLAFVLLVEGGFHPRGKTWTQVLPIDGDDVDHSLSEAAKIFYNANTACLTPASNFASARHCTAEIHGGQYADKVHKAWDAVGVPRDEPPVAFKPIALTNGMSSSAISLNENDIQEFLLEGIEEGEMIRCQTDGNNGDADMYVLLEPRSPNIECIGLTPSSKESCTTGVTSEESTARVMIHAYSAFTDLTVTCTTLRPFILSKGTAEVNRGRSGASTFEYMLPGIPTDGFVLCTLSGGDDETGLYVQFHLPPVPDPVHPVTDCWTVDAKGDEPKICLIGPSAYDTNAYVVVVSPSVSPFELVCDAA